MTNFRKSVARPAPGAGAAKPKNPLVKVIYADDLLEYPPTDENGVLMLGNIVLKDGAKTHTLYLTNDTQKSSHTTEGDADAEGIMKKFEASHPGDELEINEFVQNSLGIGFIIVHELECGSTRKKVIGTKCNPLYLKDEFSDDKEAVKHVLTFEQRMRDRHVAKFYDGELQFEENFNAALAVALAPANGYVYRLPVEDEGTAITIASNTIGNRKIVSLIGSGGEDPAVLAGGVSGPVTVLLSDGTAWTALKDAVINFEVFDAGAVTYLKEVSRR